MIGRTLAVAGTLLIAAALVFAQEVALTAGSDAFERFPLQPGSAGQARA